MLLRNSSKVSLSQKIILNKIAHVSKILRILIRIIRRLNYLRLGIIWIIKKQTVF